MSAQVRAKPDLRPCGPAVQAQPWPWAPIWLLYTGSFPGSALWEYGASNTDKEPRLNVPKAEQFQPYASVFINQWSKCVSDEKG